MVSTYIYITTKTMRHSIGWVAVSDRVSSCSLTWQFACCSFNSS